MNHRKNPFGAAVNLPSRNESPGTAPLRKMWAIGGGKGGIGKTLITSNMAVYLSWAKNRVVVVDLDLGGANLHTSLGIDSPTASLSDLILGKTDNINDLLQPTTIQNLYLISGAQDPAGIANMRHMHKMRLLRKFRELSADIVILDLGAGTTFNTLDFFLLADLKIVVVTPEPTSIENAYRFIKASYYRMLRASTPSPYLRQLIEQVMETRSENRIRTPKDLLQEVCRLSPAEGAMVQAKMEQFQLSLIVNQVRTQAEAEVGRSIEMVCEQYFGIRMNYMGYLPYDNAVWRSVRHRMPFLLEDPNSTAVTHLESIVRNLMRQSYAT